MQALLDLFQKLRPALLILLSVAVQIGTMSQEFADLLAANAPVIVSGLSAAWGIIAYFRNKREKSAV